MLFTELGLSDSILRAIEEHGYTTPTPIQAKSIPAVLKGGDLLAAAQTGTGKTAGFTLPILQRLISNAKPVSGKRQLKVLILTPTRELAAQVQESVVTYGKYTGLKSTVIFGGVGANPQIRAIQAGLDILVATPGRLLDLMSQNCVSLNAIEILVLDEADRMLDMGFLRDIKKILAALPKQRQNLLFSATFSNEIKTLADGLLNSPALIEVARSNSANEAIAQLIHPVDRTRKHPLLAHLIKSNDWKQVLVFTRTKHGANKLVTQLEKDGITSMAIHGNKSQSARTKALADFKAGKIVVLVATDIAARGIDIDQLPHVVNYDLPNVSEDYVHRIGRTGRAGSNGVAVSLVCVDEHQMLRDIEKLIKQKLPQEVIPGFEPDPNAVAQPIQLRSQQHQQSRKPKPSGNVGGGAKPPAKRSSSPKRSFSR
ncbi:DEAD/DEAH box helicase [Polynucleobacter sp. Latsch14-2]|jgi:ATP-dependent RNA helicase RhlE|uniref:DEAD/DEAH box helicase n=1 Tax=Polynucleobacter sp. Latsch14-2 TaxID=2576920 RepID=UPI001C0C23A3|nr:DEAD/DEAH box helicase [Polynucleobacter sp. Latsch14-2]MBU3614918.1 DEAD/DEAH box helicase [Polynucleobacter sp. Latsch14-2]